MPLVLIRKFWPFTVSGRGCIIPGGGAGASAMAHRMFGSGSSFRVGWRTAGDLVLAGGLGVGLAFYGVWAHSWCFLISWDGES